MKKIRPASLLLPLFLWLCCAPFAEGQTARFRFELLSLLPEDFAVCVVMHDLRGQSEHWERSAWLKTFRQSPLGKTLLDAPELRQLALVEKDLKKHFNLDWTTLRDDILGDTVLFAYRPGADNKPEDEQGLLLLHVRKPQQLTSFIDRLNDVQKKSGELKSLTELKYKGNSYHRRQQGDKVHFYYQGGDLLAVSSREELIRGVLDKKANTASESPWARRFRQAGAEQAFLIMAVNPRSLAPDFVKLGKKEDGLPGYWQALDGIFVSLSIRDHAELRVALQARVDELPQWMRASFKETIAPSVLWQRFPEASIVTIASKADFAALVDSLKILLPAKDRHTMETQLQRTLGAFLGRDIFKEVLPNIGPDWGICVFPAENTPQFPHVLLAIAVQPGSKDPPIDQSLAKVAQFLAGLALLDYNKHHADEIRMRTIKQDSTEITCLSNDKLFPPGVQPAFALKEGFLVFGTSPAAIRHFRKREATNTPPGNPLFRLSSGELAKLLRQQREQIVRKLQERHEMQEQKARQNLDSVASLLEMFEAVTLSQHAEAGQATWTLRLTPAR
jgi:hypothetical protein